jgi:hypothetical protein
MSLVDTCDSVLMLYAYAGVVEREKGFRLVEDRPAPPRSEGRISALSEGAANAAPQADDGKTVDEEEEEQKIRSVQRYANSNIGIVLTVMSIAIAFTWVCLDGVMR